MSQALGGNSPIRAKPISRPELQHVHWRFLAIQPQASNATTTHYVPSKPNRGNYNQNLKRSVNTDPAGEHTVSTTQHSQGGVDAVSQVLVPTLQLGTSHVPQEAQDTRFTREKLEDEMDPSEYSFAALHEAGKAFRSKITSERHIHNQKRANPIDALNPSVSAVYPPDKLNSLWKESVSSSEAIDATTSAASRTLAARKPKPITYVSIIASLVRDGDELLRRDLRDSYQGIGQSPGSEKASPTNASRSPTQRELTEGERKRRISDVYEERQRRRRKRLSRIGALEAGIHDEESLQLDSVLTARGGTTDGATSPSLGGRFSPELGLAAGEKRRQEGEGEGELGEEKDKEEEDLITFLQKAWLSAKYVESSVPLIGGSDAGSAHNSNILKQKGQPFVEDDESALDPVESFIEEIGKAADHDSGAKSSRPKPRRPASPVVLWKASSRVQLATHVPTALRALLIKNAVAQKNAKTPEPICAHSLNQNERDDPSTSEDGIEPPSYFQNTSGQRQDKTDPGGASRIKHGRRHRPLIPSLALGTQLNPRGVYQKDNPMQSSRRLMRLSNQSNPASSLEEDRLTERRRAEARRFGAWYFPPELWTARATAQQTLEDIDNSAAALRPDISESMLTSRSKLPVSTARGRSSTYSGQATERVQSNKMRDPSLETDANVLSLLGGSAGDSEALEEVLCHLAARELTADTSKLLKGSNGLGGVGSITFTGLAEGRKSSPRRTTSSFDIVSQAQQKFKELTGQDISSGGNSAINLPIEAERALTLKLRERQPKTVRRTKGRQESSGNITHRGGKEKDDNDNDDEDDLTSNAFSAHDSDEAAVRDAIAQRRLGETIRSLPIAKEFVKFLLSGGGHDGSAPTLSDGSHDSVSPTTHSKSVRLPSYLRGVEVENCSLQSNDMQ